MVGMYAEPPPEGFGFSDTAFRIFMLMASRRLKSDRFLSQDSSSGDLYEDAIAWVEETSMKDGSSCGTSRRSRSRWTALDVPRSSRGRCGPYLSPAGSP